MTFSPPQDKTFGLKNKKGAKQQKYIKAVTQQVKCGNQSAKKVSVILHQFSFISKYNILSYHCVHPACKLLTMRTL